VIIVCRKELLKIMYKINNSLKKANNNKSGMCLFLIILQII